MNPERIREVTYPGEGANGTDLTMRLIDDGYRIWVQFVSGGPVNVEPDERILWAEYKQCDFPCIGGKVADLLMLASPASLGQCPPQPFGWCAAQVGLRTGQWLRTSRIVRTEAEARTIADDWAPHLTPGVSCAEVVPLRAPVQPVPQADLDEQHYAPAARARQAADERMRHDYPILQQFHSRHALGAKSAPSCLCCGQQTHPITQPIAVQHLELPAIVVCKQCKDASAVDGVTVPQSQEGSPKP